PVDEADDAIAALLEIDRVDAAAVTESTDDLARLSVTLDAGAETPEAFAAITEMRDTLDQVGSGEGVVGGLDAEALDVAEAQLRDQMLIMPIILVLVLLVLIVLLRALV